jgi:DNA-directed RNA polymerase subunit RPC12/RpoP
MFYKHNIIIKIGGIMYKTGEKPGKGTYYCSNCGTKVVLDDNSDTLPPCPKCHKTTFHK